MNKFKSKRKIKIKIRYLVCIVGIFLIYWIFIYVSRNFKIIQVDDNVISKILSNSNSHLIYNQRRENIFNYILESLIDVNNPVGILKNKETIKGIIYEKAESS